MGERSQHAHGFTNIGSIAHTRHNLSQSTLGLTAVKAMNTSRNNYDEVCVYCHTPHSDIKAAQLPLWNRTIVATTYITYDKNGTLMTQAVTQPGKRSLTCLSCHDGQTAIDSIINMPGTGGRSLSSQETTSNAAFLNTWNNGVNMTQTRVHRGLNSSTQATPVTLINPIPALGFPGYTLPAGTVQGNGTGSDGIGCMTCHSDVGMVSQMGGGQQATNFSFFLIGTDLRNVHPIGVTFPPQSNTYFNFPTGTQDTSRFFDVNGDGRMDKNEIRTYEGKVECATCHDPHGVPDPTDPTGKFKPTFLRVNNAGSAVCLTCHAK